MSSKKPRNEIKMRKHFHGNFTETYAPNETVRRPLSNPVHFVFLFNLKVIYQGGVWNKLLTFARYHKNAGYLNLGVF